MTTQTPDAVREAVTEFRNRVVRLLHEMYNECTHSDTEAFAYERAEKEVRALMLPTALDSRAGDAGEGYFSLSHDDDPAFLEAWAVMEAKGFAYGNEALESVHLGWLMAKGVLSATPAPAVDAQSMSIAIGAGPARDALADLEQFLTDHSGNEETTEGMEAEDRAHKAMRFVRRVICAAMDLCDGATDDCTAGRIVTVDGDDFDQLNAALDDAAPAVDAREVGHPCDTCQGNGEVVTDWDRYMHGKPGDTGDEGTKDCPDCDGTGRIEDAPAVDAVPAREVERKAIRDEIINTPETADFMAGVPLEAAHQRDRWGADHDAGKTALDWFWLIGFLAQKAADAAMRGDIKKAKHHTISTGAALANWHAALTGTDIKMRPGISAEAQEAAEGRGALSLALQTDALSHGEGR